MATAVKPPKRRRLGDLYKVGQMFSADDGDGAVEVYMRRPNPYELENALKDGNAARAKAVLRMRKEGTTEYEQIEGSLWDIGDTPELARFIVAEMAQDLYSRAHAFVMDTDEYTEDSVLESSLDNLEKWAESTPSEGDDEYVDYQNTLEFVEKFNKDVEAKYEILREEELGKVLAEGELEEKVRRILIDRDAGVEFLREYRVSCVYYAARDPENKIDRYFEARQEVKELPYETLSQLIRWYDEIDMGREEVKNSQGAAPSSPESAPSDSPETSELSGPEDVTE